MTKISQAEFDLLQRIAGVETNDVKGTTDISSLMKKGLIRVKNTESGAPFFIDWTTYELTSNGRLEMNLFEKGGCRKAT